MFSLRNYIIILQVLLVVILTSCTGGSGDPVNPDLPALETRSINTEVSPGRSIWGFYVGTYDPDTTEPLKFIPAREISFHSNVLAFLEDNPCTDCLRVTNFVQTEQGFNVDVTIEHPWAQVPGLYGFDVRGIIFFNGSHDFPQLGVKIPSRQLGDAFLENPDGYTRLLNPSEFAGEGPFSYKKGHLVFPTMPDPTSTIGAFRAFYSIGQSEMDGGRRGFYPGDSVTQTYHVVNPGNNPLVFGYAIDSSWEPPMTKPPHGVGDFPPIANCPEPYRIDVEVTNNSLTPESGVVGLKITVYDHQDPNGIDELRIEAPGLFEGLMVLDAPVMFDTTSAVFTVQIPCETSAADLLGEEILIEIAQHDPDPNFGDVSAWTYFSVKVEYVPEQPTIDFIEPESGYQYANVPVIVHGSGFHEGIEVQLYKGLAVIPGQNVTVIDHHTVSCEFELATPVGLYTTYVQNTNGFWDELPDSFEVIPN